MAKYSALGTVLRRWNVATAAFVAVAQVGELQPPALAMDVADSTDHDNNWRESLATLKDLGEVTMTLHFDPNLAGHVALITILFARSVEFWELEFPDADDSIWQFNALVTRFQPMTPVDGMMTASVTLRGTGEPSTVGEGWTFLASEDGDFLLTEAGYPIIVS
jgi:hypothetical protein